MKRVAVVALLCAVFPLISSAASAAQPSRRVAGALTGRVVGVDGGTFTIQTAGRRMGVINALVAAANDVAGGDYPYVWGGGHAEAGVASVGIPGPGHNGRRVGFDCSGAVAAVLAGAGLWSPGAGVPNDAGVIAELLRGGVIARGAGRAPVEVTLYDDPGVHIFMNIDGRFFGTSDGGGGGNPKGGAGWLYDGAYDATSRAFRQYHVLPSVLRDRTTYGHDFTFTTGSRGDLAELAGELRLGDRIHVGYVQNRAGGMTATALAWTGARTLTGTVLGVAADGSSFTVQTANGVTHVLATNGSAWLLDGVQPGDTVAVTYTRASGVLSARLVTVSAPAVTAQATGAIETVAADGSSFTLQLPDGSTLTLSTGGVTGLLQGYGPGDTVTVTLVKTLAGTLIAEQVDPAGGQPAAARRSR